MLRRQELDLGPKWVHRQELDLNLELVRGLVHKQELDLELEQVQELVRKPEPGLDLEQVPALAYKREPDLELAGIETKGQPSKVDSTLTEQWSLRWIVPEPVDSDVPVGARRNIVYLLPNRYN